MLCLPTTGIFRRIRIMYYGQAISPDVVTRAKQSVVLDVTRGDPDTLIYASPMAEVSTITG